MSLKSMSPKFPAIAYVLILLWLFGLGFVFSETPAPTASPASSSLSPDKKWEYPDGDTAKLVKAGTSEVALKFSDDCSLGALGEDSRLVWAPDSKLFAFYSCGAGKEHLTLLYQLRDHRWVALTTPGDGDELFGQAGKIIEARAKRKGLHKKTFLHMQWWTVEPKQWLDASTLIIHASMAEVVHKNDGDYVGPGFGTDLLLTLKFDDAGNWKVVKTHRMSEKEVEEAGKEQ